MAARIEFEREWLPKLQGDLENKKKPFILDKKSSTTNQAIKTKALSSVKSEGLKSLLDNL
jgi:hypothetical protein